VNDYLWSERAGGKLWNWHGPGVKFAAKQVQSTMKIMVKTVLAEVLVFSNDKCVRANMSVGLISAGMVKDRGVGAGGYARSDRRLSERVTRNVWTRDKRRCRRGNEVGRAATKYGIRPACTLHVKRWVEAVGR